jgi:S1-C subfamily serine protease
LQLNRAAQGQSGIAITEVQPDSPAAQAGLRSGDQLLTIDGRNLTSPQQFLAYLSGQYGRQVPVVILRDGRQYTVQLTPENDDNDNTAWLGVYLNDSETGQAGAQVAQVYPAGPAARAGLRAGDIVTQVEGQSVSGAADLISIIEEQQAGSRVKLVVSRSNQQVEIPVTLGSRDSFVYRGQSEESYGGRRDDSHYGENDQYSNLPPFAMQLEHERRMYEQHQRIETEIAKLQDEIKQLRELIQQQRR